MAARTLYPRQTTAQNYSDATWSEADDDAKNQTKPIAGDTIILTTNSGTVTCDETWAAASLSATGAANWVFGAQTASVSGIITLDDITATVAAANIAASDLDIGTNGSLTMSDDLTVTGNIEVDGGDLDFGASSNTLTLAGDFIRTSGTLTNQGILSLTVSANLKQASAADSFSELILVGSITVTLSGDVYCNKFTKSSGATVTDGGDSDNIVINFTAVDNFWNAAGPASEMDCGVTILGPAQSSGSAILLNNKDLTCKRTGAGDRTITMDGDIDIGTGDLYIRSEVAGAKLTLTMVNNDVTCDGVITGNTAANTGSGVFNAGSGTITMNSLVDGNAANDSNAFNCDTATIVNAGAFDGTNITFTNTSAKLRGGGTVSNVDCSSTARLNAVGSVDGGGNQNVYFAGSKLIGAGILPFQV